ncbi:MAG: CoA transferase, partial [Sphingomonadales bacterium]|nr:CoA transferase [Sphingomonadales bacterium]
MTTGRNLSRGALHGLRVIEWGSEISAPYASRLLADLGADVIKIECGAGDPMRQHEPFHFGGASALFAYLNAGKRAVRVDPARDRADIVDLVSRADILIEDLGPGGLEQAGLGPTELRAANPLLNIIRLSDYGQQFSEMTVTEFIMQAQAGWIEGREGETRPLMVGGRLSEYIAGAYLAAAALTALRTSRLTSVGVDADVSRLECAHSMLCCPAVTLRVLEKLGGGTNRTTLLGTKPCRDGWAGINVVTQRQWADLCKLVGAPEYAGRREEFRQGGVEHDSFENHVSNWTRSRTVLDVVNQCQGQRIPAVALHDGKSIMEEPQWRERSFFTDAACPDAGFVHPPSPWRLSETPAAIRGRAPSLGEHDDELPHLGWEKRAANVVAVPSDTLPLKGLRVLSLGTYWSGSSVASYLGAMGADVVKVESIQRP